MRSWDRNNSRFQPDNRFSIAHRFIKQSYNLEDIRVLKYRRLKNLVVLVTAAAYFAATR